MAHKKAGGSSRNGRNILVRQRGTKWHPGVNVGIGKDHTLFAKAEGAVEFKAKANGRTYVSVMPLQDAAE